ncbi:MAG: hypothetical protein AB8G99_01400 [Planctomycetaceae bacterium]
MPMENPYQYSGVGSPCEPIPQLPGFWVFCMTLLGTIAGLCLAGLVLDMMASLGSGPAVVVFLSLPCAGMVYGVWMARATAAGKFRTRNRSSIAMVLASSVGTIVASGALIVWAWSGDSRWISGAVAGSAISGMSLLAFLLTAKRRRS